MSEFHLIRRSGVVPSSPQRQITQIISCMRTVSSRAAAIIAMAIVTACGGGGGGGGDSGGNNGGSNFVPLTYQGSTSQASISTSNAKRFFDLVFGTQPADAFSALSTSVADDQTSAGPGATSVAPLLRRYLISETGQTQNAWSPYVAVNVTELCAGGGTFRLVGELDDSTGLGTLTGTFDGCVDAAGSLSGEVVYHIRGYDEFYGITDVLMQISLLRLVGASSDVSISGTIVSVGDGYYLTSFDNVDVVMLDNGTGRYAKFEDFRSEYSNFGLTLAISGRVYDSIAGYVDISTTNPLRFLNSTESYPSSGGPLVFTGVGSTLSVTPTSSTLAALRLVIGLDTFTAEIAWGSSAEPIFAPLSYTVSFSLLGMFGQDLVVQNGADRVTVPASAPPPPGTSVLMYTFPAPVPSGSSYSVSVTSQPTSDTIAGSCAVENGDGVIAHENVTDVVVRCTRDRFAVNVDVSGLSGSGLVVVLHATGQPAEYLPISANGSHAFLARPYSGDIYSVFVSIQPGGQTCTAYFNGGIVEKSDVQIVVDCV